ncbi:MAG: transmembrane BAX inhibitor motif protein-containing protein 1 [Synergistales bacterium]|nr:transmembrane BAX inhibitor motif protein-containing protein 1 [Synergistales bacterium]
MRPRQIFVNVVIVLALVAIGIFCYNEGKANDLFLDNVPYDHDGKVLQPFEAVLVSVDGVGEPLFLVEGDRGVVTVPGRKHVIVVEELDDEDKVIKTHKVSFSNKELKGRVISLVPLLQDKLPGWSYPVKK